MKTLTKKQIKTLEKRFGNHTQAAKEIGITPRYYRNLRSGKFKPGRFLVAKVEWLIENYCKPKDLIK